MYLTPKQKLKTKPYSVTRKDGRPKMPGSFFGGASLHGGVRISDTFCFQIRGSRAGMTLTGTWRTRGCGGRCQASPGVVDWPALLSTIPMSPRAGPFWGRPTSRVDSAQLSDSTSSLSSRRSGSQAMPRRWVFCLGRIVPCPGTNVPVNSPLLLLSLMDTPF